MAEKFTSNGKNSGDNWKAKLSGQNKSKIKNNLEEVEAKFDANNQIWPALLHSQPVLLHCSAKFNKTLTLKSKQKLICIFQKNALVFC